WRFADVRREPPPVRSATPEDGAARVGAVPAPWRGPAADTWTSSLDESGYRAAVSAVRASVYEGEVYQANICRVMSAPLGAPGSEPDAHALTAVLAGGNPAPHAGMVHVPRGAAAHHTWVVSASPE